ncbi:SH3 domain-containing kinase-binding protein 1-like isoform X4 [Physella acuta]|uniref:SH3 domain-containing kinase-binding protein 1-like isoform X4 n=1 Tax=Physella acuta TaxID=109671 RepID=UPI0027DB0941|nr:SH3 domain-containing kinase-binding protein 1-like isoform X4 [Physella acuta]
MEAVVEFEYVAEQEDELSLKVGDIITNVITAEGGWWEGELNGKKGMFPENFVKLVKRREPTVTKKEEKREATQRKSVRELANKFKDGVPIGVAPKKKEKKKKCKVLFEYKKENDDELDLQVGEIIDFHKQVEEGWWEGSLNGKHGVFPSNFVEMLDEPSSSDESVPPEEKEKTEPQSKDENFQTIKGKKVVGVGLGNIFGAGPIKLRPTAESGKKEDNNKGVKPTESDSAPEVAKREKQTTVERAIVRFSYAAEQPDELSLTEGQIVRILDKELEDEGWWKGEVNGKIGVFPDNFVELIPNEEPNKPKKPPLPAASAKHSQPSKLPDKPSLEIEEKNKTGNPSSFSTRKSKTYPTLPPHSKELLSQVKRAQIAKELSTMIDAVEHMGEEDTMVLFRPDARGRLHYYYESSSTSVSKKPVAPPPIGKKPLNQKLPEQRSEPSVPTKPVSIKDKSTNRDVSDERASEDSSSFDGIEPAGQKLTHLTANRAKGPKKRPPSTVLTLNDGEKDSDTMDEMKVSYTDRAQLSDKHQTSIEKLDKPLPVLPPKDTKHQIHPPSEPEAPSLPAQGHTSSVTRERDVHISAPPPRPPEPSSNKAPASSSTAPSLQVSRLLEQLQRELSELKANSVSKAAFQELRAEHEKLKGEFESLRNIHSKKFRELENEVDEEKKLRLTTQVEIERVKKFMSETNV